MTPLRQTNLRLEEEILEALDKIRERDGVPASEQVRRALKVWIAEKGLTPRVGMTDPVLWKLTKGANRARAVTPPVAGFGVELRFV